MQQHPVPQNVTGYEFHLIGQMTLKQFIEVAGGILIAVIINTTNLPVILKYPIMMIAVIIGVSLAFVPLEGRPLDRWFFAFIKSIYQPTMFFWKKTDHIPEPFLYTQPKNLDTTPTIDYKPMRQSRVSEFLQTIPAAQTKTTDPEDERIAQVLALFTAPAAMIQQIQSAPAPTQETVIIPKPPASTVVLPEAPAPISVQSTANGDQTITQSPQPLVQSGQMTEVFSAQKSASTTSASAAQTDASLPFPSKPTEPNMIVGMVFSQDKKIIDNAIVTIHKKSDDTPVRALKTNLLGQFAIITPLEDGEYVITVEKDGYRFDNTGLVLNNQVVDPILIQSSGA